MAFRGHNGALVLTIRSIISHSDYERLLLLKAELCKQYACMHLPHCHVGNQADLIVSTDLFEMEKLNGFCLARLP